MAALDEKFIRGLLPKGSLAIPFAGRFTPLGGPMTLGRSRTRRRTQRPPDLDVGQGGLPSLTNLPGPKRMRGPPAPRPGSVEPVRPPPRSDTVAQQPVSTGAPFVKPTTQEGWLAFHKMNEEGMAKAYASPDGLYKEGGRLYIAGTRGGQDVMDWPKIAFGTFRNSAIYQRAEPAFKEDPGINMVIGHSAGGLD